MWTSDQEFIARSMQNKRNRGHGGTHVQGNRSFDRFKEYKVQPPSISRHVPFVMHNIWSMHCRWLLMRGLTFLRFDCGGRLIRRRTHNPTRIHTTAPPVRPLASTRAGYSLPPCVQMPTMLIACYYVYSLASRFNFSLINVGS